MTLYRVQSAIDGCGPWRLGVSGTWVDHSRKAADYIKLVPWPEQFGSSVLQKLKPGEKAGCGCTSPEQLKLWFTEQEYFALLKRGYRAVTFDDARILARSDIQCVFARPVPLRFNVTPFVLY